jgi:hypothetical protein
VSASAGLSAGAFGAAPSPAPLGASSGRLAGDAALGGTRPGGNTAADDGAALGGDGPQARDPVQALAYLEAGLEFLARADAAEWPAGLQADCLRAVAESRQAAAHARVLAAFAVPGGGLAGDGHRSPRVWLTWQTRATRAAAFGHVARMHDLAEHPAVAAALACGQVSLSWARQIIDWSGRLPEDYRGAADADLLAAALRGADLPGLARIAEDLYRRHASADAGDDGFDDRAVRFAATFDGAGRLEGDLTGRCAAAVQAVLDSLSALRGPEDTRTLAQRRHDALEEACTRLIAADCLPQRAGQPVRLELTITLDELARNGRGSPAGPGAACDAAIQPVVTGHVDYDLLQRLAGPGDRQQAAAGQAAGRPRPPPPAGHSPAVRPGRDRRPAPPPARRPDRHHQPAAGHRRHRGHHPRPPAPRGPQPRPALPVPRLRPARRRLRRPPPHPPQRRRPARPRQPHPALQIPSPHRHPPLGLAANPEPRRHHHRYQP